MRHRKGKAESTGSSGGAAGPERLCRGQAGAQRQHRPANKQPGAHIEQLSKLLFTHVSDGLPCDCAPGLLDCNAHLLRHQEGEHTTTSVESRRSVPWTSDTTRALCWLN